MVMLLLPEKPEGLPAKPLAHTGRTRTGARRLVHRGLDRLILDHDHQRLAHQRRKRRHRRAGQPARPAVADGPEHVVDLAAEREEGVDLLLGHLAREHQLDGDQRCELFVQLGGVARGRLGSRLELDELTVECVVELVAVGVDRLGHRDLRRDLRFRGWRPPGLRRRHAAHEKRGAEERAPASTETFSTCDASPWRFPRRRLSKRRSGGGRPRQR
jgi:hypothetical protein